MTKEQKIQAIDNRIELLASRKAANSPIVAKLRRKRRKIEKEG